MAVIVVGLGALVPASGASALRLGAPLLALQAFPSAAALTSQTITFGALAGKTYGAAPFTVSATASSGLTVSFASLTTPVCTVSGTTVTIVAAGTCTIRASQAGDATYAAAPNVNQSFTVAKASQTITFGALAGKVYGDPTFTVSATASSGLAVTFTSTTTTICTIATATVTIKAAGTCTIQAAQAGNANYLAATNVSQSFTVAKANQTITFGALAGKNFGDPAFTVSATASSALTVTFTSTTTTICTIATATVTIKAVGTCTIQAAQAGNANYNAAPNVTQSFAIAKGNQTITFGALANKALGSGTFTVSATASSGLAVTFTSTTTTVCTIAGTTVTLKIVGVCTLQAAQAGNANYNAAPNINQSFNVTQGSQTITFNALANKTLGAAPFTISATASSGLVVSFASLTTSVCTASGTSVTLVGGGTCTIQASQAGNVNYLAAPNVSQSFTVAPGSQTITFPAIGAQIWGAAPFTISATASSGLAVVFLAQSPAACSVSGSTVTLVGVGTCSVLASQAGNANYAAAFASQSFAVVGPIDFAPAVNYAGGADWGIATGDFGWTGKLDVAVAAGISVLVFTGIGDGTLGASAALVSNGTSMRLAVADLNSDGHPDLVWINADNTAVNIRLGTGNHALGPVQTLTAAFEPTAVVLADLNGDGKADLIVTNGYTLYSGFTGQTVQVFLGIGDGTFQAPRAYTVPAWPQAVAVADVNGDGKPDLLVTSYIGNNFTVLLGSGDGTFAVGASYATQPQPTLLVAGDFNGDGIADVAVNSLNINAVGSISIFLGRGDGTFATPTVVTGEYANFSGTMVTADFNGDGRLDLAHTVYGDVAVLAGVGDGTFLPAVLLATGSYAQGLAAADLNADGRLDLLVSDSGTGNLVVLLNTGVLTTTTTVTAQTGTPQSATINSAYASSLSVLVRDGASRPLVGQDVVFSAPTFGPTATFAGGVPLVQATTNAAGIATAPSLTANGIAGAFTVVASIGNASAAFALTNVGTANSAPAFVSGVLPNGTINTSYAYTVIASGSPAPTISVTPGALPPGLALNGTSGLVSGIPTTVGTFAGMLTAANGQAPNATQTFAVTIVLNSQTITFAAFTGKTYGAAPFAVSATASSGLPVSFASTTAVVCTMSGNTVTIIAVGTCTIQATQAGNATYAAAPAVNRSFTVAKASQTITFAPLLNHFLSGSPFTVAATASSGLGVTFTSLTTAVCTVSGTTVTLVTTGTCTIRAAQAGNANYLAAANVSQSFTVKPNGTDQPPTVSWIAPLNNSSYVAPAIIPLLATAGDADGTIFKVEFYNGAALLGTATAAPFGYVWRNVGTGAYTLTAKAYDDLGTVTTSTAITVTVAATGSTVLFGTATNFPTSSGNAVGVLPMDVNSDGLLDLAVPFNSGQSVVSVDVMRGGSNGGFDLVGTALGSQTCGVGYESTAGDFNGDGKTDVAIASSLYKCVAIFLSNGNGTMASAVAHVQATSPAAIASGDFNGDGKRDLVTANDEGSVSLLVGNGDGTLQPETAIAAGIGLTGIAVGDFNGDSMLDVVATDGSDVSVRVLLGNGNGTFQAAKRTSTGVSPNYPTRVAVGDFNGDGKLDAAVSNYTTTNVTVLIGNGDGTFQSAVDYPAGTSGIGIAAADVNGDGKLDLVVATDEPIGSVTILLGNGNGTFRAPVSFLVGADPAHVAIADYNGNGKPDIAVETFVGISVITNLTGVTLQAPAFTNGPPPPAVWRQPYQFTFTATGVPPPLFSAINANFQSSQITLGTNGLLSTVLNADTGIYRGTAVASNGVVPDATQDFAIVIGRLPQTITFTAPSSLSVNIGCLSLCDWPLTVSSDTGMPVQVVSMTPNLCTVDSQNRVTPVSAGTCLLRAEQPGDLYSLPAPSVDRTVLIVAKGTWVTLTAPVDHAGYVAPAAITFNAVAVTVIPGNTLTVAYINAATGAQLGTASVPPYAFTWTNVAAATYSIIAQSTEINHASGEIYTHTSYPITVIVTTVADTPTVTLTSPAANATYYTPAAITLAATAGNGSGTVSRVDFHSGPFWIGTSTSSPYTFTWNLPQEGTYALTAHAYSGNAVVGISSPVSITVTTDLSKPLAAFAFDEPWDSYELVLDTLGGLSGIRTGAVAHSVAGLSGAKPDTCQAANFSGGVIDLNSLPVATTAGSSTSLAFWLNWSGADGAMPLSWAAQGLIFSGGSFGFTTNAGDVYGIAAPSANSWHHVVAEFNNGGVTANKLYLDGVAQTLSQRSGTPNLANALVSATLRLGGKSGAATNRFSGQLDELQLFAGSLSPSHVAALPPIAHPCAPLWVYLAAPVPNAAYHAPASIELFAAGYSANYPMTHIDYYNGATLIGYGSIGPGGYSSPFRWTNVPAGTYALTARLSDYTGANVTSAPITVTVSPANGVSTVTAPFPTAGATYYSSEPIVLTTDATAAPGYRIEFVQWYANGVLVGSAAGYPYEFVWRNVTPGTYTIVAKVTDNAGLVTPTAPITITVILGAPSIVYYYNDPAGSPLAASDQYGTLLWDETYWPYGERSKNEDPSQNGLWYTGKPSEDTTGLQYFGGRWYNPAIGRFYSVDPVGFRETNPFSFNRYAYGNNNPYRYIDPDGNEDKEIRSPDWMRATIPGQVLWDSARTALANGDYGFAGAAVGGMGAEIFLAAVTGGSSQGVRLAAGQGGRFASLVGPVADDLTAHHIPQAALKFTSRADGGAVVMTTAEHEATRTFGYKGALSAVEDSGKALRDVLAKDIRDVRSIVGDKYNRGLQDVVRYYKENFPQLMNKE